MTPPKKPLRFKSREAYLKWNAFGHIHGDFAKVPGHQKIVIGGKPHRVKHSSARRRK